MRGSSHGHVAVCPVCGRRSTDDGLDGFHRLMWADRPEVDDGSLPSFLRSECDDGAAVDRAD